MWAIRTKNLTKHYKVKVSQGFWRDLFKPKYRVVKAVDGIDLKIKEGEIVGFIGPNGAGKSTTIKMLIGILHPTKGEVYTLGKVPYLDRERLTKEIGVVFGQKRTFWPELSVRHNLEMLGLFYDLSKKEIEKRIEELNEFLGLEEFINQSFRKLSLGQQMKSELAGALIHKPKLLLLDEPTIGMDILAKFKFIELIKEINKKFGTTILLTSHDLQEIEKLCKRIIIINKGKIVYDGDLDKIKPKKILIEIKTGEGVRKYEIERNKIKEFISSLEEEVLDITIKEIPIEEVIKQFYKKK
jgi:ABC-2 type transport system ATP-binding protein